VEQDALVSTGAAISTFLALSQQQQQQHNPPTLDGKWWLE